MLDLPNRPLPSLYVTEHLQPGSKALASHPKEFHLVGSYRARWARIGNSMPPLLMKAIADHIRNRFFANKPSAP